MANKNKNYLVRKTKKLIEDYRRAEQKAAQASWILRNADKEMALSGSRPNTITKYKIDGVTGQYRRISEKNEPVDKV